jgi:hypothetical protein
MYSRSSYLHRAVLAVTVPGCIHWGSSEPYIPRPASPGDACADRAPGDPKACPQGMWCADAQSARRHRVGKPGRCGLESGRCASACDCVPNDTCGRSPPAAGYCAPAPALAAAPHGCL